MSTETVRDMQEALAQMQGLLKLPGWKLILGLAEEQLTGRIDAVILNPVSGVDGTLNQEYLKGEISGIKLFCKMPEILIEQYRSDITAMKGNEDGE